MSKEKRSVLPRDVFMECFALELRAASHPINFCLWHRQQGLVPVWVGAQESVIEDRTFLTHKDIICPLFAKRVKNSLLAEVRLIRHGNGGHTRQRCDPDACISTRGPLR